MRLYTGCMNGTTAARRPASTLRHSIFLSSTFIIPLKPFRGYPPPLLTPDPNQASQGGEVAGAKPHRSRRSSLRKGTAASIKSSCPSPPNTHCSHPNPASQGDKVAGSKRVEPEEARFERAQPALIPRVLPRNTRKAPSTTKILPALPALSLSKGACRREPACIELVESAEGIILSILSKKNFVLIREISWQNISEISEICG